MSVDRDRLHTRRLTLAAVNAAAVVERCSEQVLPSVYAYVAASFGSDPAHLGLLTLARSLVQAATSPVAGLAGQTYHRGHSVACGCLMWAVCAAAFAAAPTLGAAAPAWALAGAGLALIVPNAQSLVADLTDPGSRGRAFGTMHLAAATGGMAGALAATNAAAALGWRGVFFGAAILAAGVGAACAMVVEDPARPRHGLGSGASKLPPLRAAFKDVGPEIIALLKVPSFAIIVAQGVAGNVAWAALVFLTLYFQLLGMSPLVSSLLVAVFMAGVAAGGLLGGVLGDAAAALWPAHGRVAVAQASVAAGIPFAITLIRWMPGAHPAAYALLLFIGGAAKAWPAPAANNPIFAEIVPARRRTLVYALDRCFETALAAATAPLVGALAQRGFGFSGAAAPSGDAAADAANARALGDALLAFTVGPWAVVLVMYSALHWTYPVDARAAAAAAAAGVEAVSEAEVLRSGAEDGDDYDVLRLLPREGQLREAR